MHQSFKHGRSLHLNQARLNNRLTRARSLPHAPQSKRARQSGLRDHELPFTPPEDWHEPRDRRDGYRIVVQPPGEGYRHVLTPDDVRQRLAQFPPHFTASLEVVQFSRMTRKKRTLPCYGLQWGTAIYLYPLEVDLVEVYSQPPTPAQQIEMRMYGGQWRRESNTCWKLIWTEETIRDFYLNNILVHELAHLLDEHNTRPAQRERFAEWFAIHYGYRPTRSWRRQLHQRLLAEGKLSALPHAVA